MRPLLLAALLAPSTAAAGDAALARALIACIERSGQDPRRHPWLEWRAEDAVATEEGRTAVASGICVPRQGPESAGPLPVDQAGARGAYSLPGQGARSAAPGETLLALHLLAENFMNSEHGSSGFLEQRYETQSAAVSVRRGLKLEGERRLELGAQLQAHRQSPGILNGFIMAVEKAASAATGREEAQNVHRSGPESIRRGYRLELEDGSSVSRRARGWGIGDLRLSAAQPLRDSPAPTFVPRVTARLALNLPMASPRFTQGAWAGAGLAAEMRPARRLAVHTDLRATLPLEAYDAVGLALKPFSVGLTAALEWLFSERTSAALQMDGNTSPYKRTGLDSIDRSQGAISLGVNRSFERDDGQVRLTVYGRENFDLASGELVENSDPDFAVGVLIGVE